MSKTTDSDGLKPIAGDGTLRTYETVGDESVFDGDLVNADLELRASGALCDENGNIVSVNPEDKK